MTARDIEILRAELRGTTAEFLGWLTGLIPPSDQESIPPEMRPAFEKMVSRLTEAAKHYAASLVDLDNQRLREALRLARSDLAEASRQIDTELAFNPALPPSPRERA